VGAYPKIWNNALFEHDLSMVRTLLGDRAAPLLEAGQALTLEEAVRLGLTAPEAAGRSHGDRGPLTAREREVAVLVAHGLTNRQIADRLVIASRTAGNHVEHILDKLQLGTRAQIAAWA